MYIRNYLAGFILTVQQLLRRTLVLLVFASAGLTILSACKGKKVFVQDASFYYTCAMHPQINLPGPGKCPICGMQLIKAKKSDAAKPDEIVLSEQQIQLGNIHVDTIGTGLIGSETVLNASLNYNQRKLTSISSRVMGRVEKLYHKNTGEYIRKGEPLMEIYSEELNNAKQEYLLALEKRRLLDNSIIDFEQVISSAKTKLMLWGMTEGQVNAFAKDNKPLSTTTVYSNASGYITELNIQEGEYVMEGGSIVQVADLTTLWVEAQVYASQFSLVNANSNVIVQLPDIGKEITGKPEFINPEISPDKRISLIRITIPNPGGLLKPGMSAYVILKGGQRNVLSLPIEAVIRDGKGASVWVRTGKNTFKNKMVKLGMESGDRIEVADGLTQGEEVVVSGAYLINSEYIFKKGASPMGGMKM